MMMISVCVSFISSWPATSGWHGSLGQLLPVLLLGQILTSLSIFEGNIVKIELFAVVLLDLK